MAMMYYMLTLVIVLSLQKVQAAEMPVALDIAPGTANEKMGAVPAESEGALMGEPTVAGPEGGEGSPMGEEMVHAERIKSPALDGDSVPTEPEPVSPDLLAGDDPMPITSEPAVPAPASLGPTSPVPASQGQIAAPTHGAPTGAVSATVPAPAAPTAGQVRASAATVPSGVAPAIVAPVVAAPAVAVPATAAPATPVPTGQISTTSPAVPSGTVPASAAGQIPTPAQAAPTAQAAAAPAAVSPAAPATHGAAEVKAHAPAPAEAPHVPTVLSHAEVHAAAHPPAHPEVHAPEKAISLAPELPPMRGAPAGAAQKPVAPTVVNPAELYVPKKVFEKAEGPQAAVVSIEEKNKQADKAYLKWLVRDNSSFLSPSLRIVLNEKAITYLVNESVLPFGVYWDPLAINEKIQRAAFGFKRKFDPRGKIPLDELDLLIRKLITPERVFQARAHAKSRLEGLYSHFMSSLAEHVTPVNTTLEEWALRFLTSESMLIALPLVEAVDKKGLSFNQLTPQEKQQQLEPVVDILAQRFLNNLEPVQEKFSILMPGRIDEVIKNKLRSFLYKKFVSTLV